jgi:hypothetical protein
MLFSISCTFGYPLQDSRLASNFYTVVWHIPKSTFQSALPKGPYTGPRKGAGYRVSSGICLICV